MQKNTVFQETNLAEFYHLWGSFLTVEVLVRGKLIVKRANSGYRMPPPKSRMYPEAAKRS
jgi:hypothetical protein